MQVHYQRFLVSTPQSPNLIYIYISKVIVEMQLVRCIM